MHIFASEDVKETSCTKLGAVVFFREWRESSVGDDSQRDFTEICNNLFLKEDYMHVLFI